MGGRRNGHVLTLGSGGQMGIEKPNWMFQADPSRQAADPLRGYLYQAWQALYAWLELHEDEVLYLEGAEDFDIVGPISGTPVQVKDTCGKIALRTQCATDAISNYWRRRRIHGNKTIKYLTETSVVDCGIVLGHVRSWRSRACAG